MRFGLSQQLSTRFLALLGVAALAITGEVSVALLAILGAAFLVSFAQVWWRFRYSISKALWNIVTIIVFAFAVLDVLWISRSLLIGSVHFLIYLTVLKLLTLESSRDHLQLTLISFLHLMASSTLTTEFFYAVIFLLYLIVAIWTLLLYNLRAGAEAQGRTDALEELDRERVLKTPFVLLTTAVGLLSFVFTFGIFFIIPRIGVGLMQKKPGEPIQTVGFSGKVDLGAIGSVKLDSTIVMRVSIPGRGMMIGEGLYYRGATFDNYDGRAWKNNRRSSVSLPRDGTGLFMLRPVSRDKGNIVVQQITLEPLDLPVLFGVSRIQAITGGFFALEIDGGEGIRVPMPLSHATEYSVTSSLEILSESEMAQSSFEYPPDVLSRYLQLPGGEEAVARLGEEITRDAPTPFEKIRSIQRHLLSEYRYSLDTVATPGVSPIDDFLFVRKTGFCEHYATAMVLMLRSIKIPARIATGFYGGEWNEFGNYFTVYKSDAHAWVEVYFPRSGWVTFDPTPGNIGNPRMASLAAVSRYVDAMRQKWRRYIIDYDIQDQVRVAEKVRNKGINLKLALQQAVASVKEVWGDVLGVARGHPGTVRGGLTVILLVLLLIWLRDARLRSGGARLFPHGTAYQDRITSLYAQILRVLSTRGLPKPDSMTPREFVPQVRPVVPVSQETLFRITECYYAVRFGDVTATAEMEGEMMAVLQAIKEAG